MELYGLDYETYYSKDYSLSKMTMEAYIRDPRFEVIMLGVIHPNRSKELVTGTHADVQQWFDRTNWGDKAIAAHNALFDAAISSWHFGVKPKLWCDTLSMGRAMFGNKGNSLAALAKRYKFEEKGTAVMNAMGKRRADFTPAQFDEYADYCLHDADLCIQLFDIMGTGWYDLDAFDIRHKYPKDELRLIDLIIRMFTEPALKLNTLKLQEHLNEVRERKEKLLNASNTNREDLLSNEKFADLLRTHGIVPPTKISATTGKTTYAFAKTDPGLNELLEHPNPDVQALVAARVGIKSTLEETRTERLLAISLREGCFPVPLRYAAAKTHRLAGTDGINMQNLPSRGAEKNKLKSCIEAPPGHVIIDADSSNIEARGVAWLAGQNDLLEDFKNKIDVYAKMASAIYNKPINKDDNPTERFVGKTVVLGAGYGTGSTKLKATLAISNPPIEVNLDEANHIINTYRSAYPNIPKLWKHGQVALQAMHDNREMFLGEHRAVIIQGNRGVLLPNGLYIHYPQLHAAGNDEFGRIQWQYKGEYGITSIHGAKLIENVVQALAGIIVKQQMLRIAKRYKVVLTVHDAVTCLAPEEDAAEAVAYVAECMRWVPPWAEGWPLDCEIDVGYNYGETKPWKI